MADTGLKSPTVSVSGGQWTNPDNVFTSNNARAREDQNGQSQQWRAFAFGVPAGATIDGIQVSIEGQWEDSNSIDVELSWNAGANWTSPVKNANGFGYSDTTDTVGGSADTWGRTWSDSDFSDANFRIRLTKQGQDYVWMDVDHLQVRVWYTTETCYESYTNVTNQSSEEIKSDLNRGQSFSHNSGNGTYKINRVKLMLQKDTDAPSQTVTVQIRDSWGGTVLGSGTIASSALTNQTPTWESIDLTGNVTLTDSTTYFIRITSDSSGKVFVDKGGAGTYSNGTYYYDGVSVPNDDMFFSVCYDSTLYPEGEGWSGGSINTVSNPTQAAVNGVLIADISKVNTV